MSIKRNTFRHIESEIYDYHDTLKKIKLIREEVLNASSLSYSIVPPDPSRSPSDPTGRKATWLASNMMLLQSQRFVDAIHSTYLELPTEKKKLIHLKYWDRPIILTWEGIAQKLNITTRQASRWRREFVYETARKLGMS